MFSTAEILMEEFNNLPETRRQEWISNFLDSWSMHGRSAITLDTIRARLVTMRSNALSHTIGKGARPWNLVDMTKRLDPKQNWIGIEFETGFDDEEDYEAVASFVWDNTLHSTLDYEGCGAYPVEITFAPVNQEDFEAKNFEMDNLLKFMKSKAHGAYPHDAYEQVGTHCNISTPTYRAMADNSDTRWKIACILNNSIGLMSQEQVRELFGREPYGGFYDMRTEHCYYIEGKLFNSTDDYATWSNYKTIIVNIAGVIEELCLLAEAKKLPAYDESDDEDNCEVDDYGYTGWDSRENGLYIANLYNILMGTAALDEMDFKYGDEDARCLS